MRRQRGFTLMEILIAMALAGIVTASVLSLVRTQLSAFEMNDQIMRTQQNARAALDFVESTVRRACGGISAGSVGVNVGSVQKVVPCLQYFDAATPSGGTFTTNTNNYSDALQVVYATGTMAALTAVPSFATATPSVNVTDVSQFSVGDFVLVGDYATAYLFKIQSISPMPVPSGAHNQVGTLTFVPTSVNASNFAPNPAPALKVGSPVFKAATYSFFVAPSTGSNVPPPYCGSCGGTTGVPGMLMVDSNGVASSDNVSVTAYTGNNNTPANLQPAVEAVDDFQVAIGNDVNPTDGIITENPASPGSDEWIGNATGETLAPPPWFGTGLPNPKQVRLSILLNTVQQYSGRAPLNTTGFEDRPSNTYPVPTAAYNPRYRTARIIVSPRGWNLSE